MDTAITEAAPSKADLEALYDELFAPPALDATKDETEERDELDAYALVREVAEEYPAVARKAARDGTDAHYRGEPPFDYPIEDERGGGDP